MSSGPNDGSSKLPGQPVSAQGPNQAERNGTHAEIVHPDGRRESVELYSERVWSGVLPRPEDFAKFGEIVPDAPERILRMAEAEQAHRIAIEAKIVGGNAGSALRGQILGALISPAALGLAALSAWLGAHPTVSIALVGVPVLSVARSLVAAWRRDD